MAGYHGFALLVHDGQIATYAKLKKHFGFKGGFVMLALFVAKFALSYVRIADQDSRGAKILARYFSFGVYSLITDFTLIVARRSTVASLSAVERATVSLEDGRAPVGDRGQAPRRHRGRPARPARALRAPLGQGVLRVRGARAGRHGPRDPRRLPPRLHRQGLPADALARFGQVDGGVAAGRDDHRSAPRDPTSRDPAEN